MAAPKFAPAGPLESQYYSSPDVVPDPWSPERPGVVEGLQPVGRRLGAQGPDQGFALKLARRKGASVHTTLPLNREDAIRGCLTIALRRASLFSRAPMVHDVDIAFTIWGFYDERPPADLVAAARRAVRGRRQRQPPLRGGAQDRRPGPRVDAADEARRGARRVPVALA